MVTGFILLDKPAGITSHDVVSHVRKLIQVGLPTKFSVKIGHAGTLDPFATGLLIILLGSATRLAEYLLDLPKTYETEITLGATSDTDDSTGYITPPYKEIIPNQKQVKQVLHSFTGSIFQVPPAYAATKIKGRRAYDYARAGERMTQPPRPIKIYATKLLRYHHPTLQLRVTCGRGTYLRALARDLGAALKTGGYCSTLRRLTIGQFAVEDAYKLTNLPTELSTAIQPVELLVDHLPKIILSADNVAKFRQGKAAGVPHPLTFDTVYSIFDTSSHLIGIGQSDATTPTLLRPHKVIDNKPKDNV